MSERFDVVVVGSGAGGGVVAGELAERGRSVLLLECGPHLTAADFSRWEAKATHDLFWPMRFALIDGGAGGAVALLGGRCVGGSTTINTKVALRGHAKDIAKWHAASGLTGSDGGPFGPKDLARHYDRVEARLGVRERNDWPRSVRTVEPGFRALGAELESVRSYTDGNCMRCGSCLQGCPTNAGKSTLNTYIHDAWAAGRLELRAGVRVERVVIENGEATGVEYTDGQGAPVRVAAGAVVVAAGTLNTPQLLLRSGLPDSASSRLVGRNLGFHPARLVYGLFDEPQDTHMVYPITAHAMAHQHDEDGGFVVEATTIQDPIGFATTLEDENGPLWGAAAGRGRARVPPLDRRARDGERREQRQRSARRERRGVVRRGVQRRASTSASTARSTSRGRCWRRPAPRASAGPGCFTTHVQGTCRMGSDPERSVVDADAQSWDVKRLYVGDGSLVPRTLSVNPSLTIMALASRLAEHLHADPHGYLA